MFIQPKDHTDNKGVNQYFVIFCHPKDSGSSQARPRLDLDLAEVLPRRGEVSCSVSVDAPPNHREIQKLRVWLIVDALILDI